MKPLCTETACGVCAMCCNEQLVEVPAFATPAAAREAARSAASAKRLAVCRPIGYAVRALSKRQRVDVARGRLCAFLRLMRVLDTAPWASTVFDVNDRMLRVLTATHLHLIVGKKEFGSADRPALLQLVDPGRNLDGLCNVVWVTNRQQGKTSTLGKFIAALAIHSPVGGDLCNVYATSLDRANELTKAAREYVSWIRTIPGYSHISMTKNNNTTFVVSNGDAANTVVARPKNPDSCRGDAPEACFFDEVGFVGEAFWYKFAFPLLQVSLRVATCTTTPPPKGGFFDTFLAQVQKRNDAGDRFFWLSNHSLSCAQCAELGEAENCCHNLRYVPPWKSMLRFSAMRSLIPKKQIQTFETEVYGVLRSANATYFPPKLVDAAFDRARYTGDVRPDSSDGIVWVGIDPAGHGVSDMGIAAITFRGGQAVIVGAASVNVNRSDVPGVLALVKVFLRRLRKLVPAPAPICPIVEVNNNEVYSHSIVRAFDEFAPIYMPFTKERFRVACFDGIGVRTTHETKMQMVQHGYLAFVEGRVVVASTIAHVSRADTMPKSAAVAPDDHLDELASQLKRFHDEEKALGGKPDITSKTSGGDNDDIGVAFLLALYWSACVRAAEGIEGHV